jgi:hypothetical protein
MSGKKKVGKRELRNSRGWAGQRERATFIIIIIIIINTHVIHT